MNTFIPRLIGSKITESNNYYRVIVITGPRQSGKTRLCKHLYPDYRYVNLENITDRTAAEADPDGFLHSLGKRAIIDEVQNVPSLLSMIQVKVDENPEQRYVLTGSSNFSLLEKVTQSLAGRVALFTLLPFSTVEIRSIVQEEATDKILQDGGFPGVIVNRIPAYDFYRNYYNTYVERDIRNLLKVKNIGKFDTFIRLLANRLGSEFNASAIAREVGMSSNTISDWLSLLQTSYIAFPLRPYYSNISKRLTKMPKIYFYDSGLLCYLLGIETYEQVTGHQMKGQIFENFAVTEILKSRLNEGKDPDLYYYREQSGCEVDVVVSTVSGLELYEIKASKTLKPEFLTNMKLTGKSLQNVASSTVIYDGESIAPLAINIREI